ncbi:MAG: SAM-dependent chlorinase/fluorinase [Gammaproteobacteria bacterium]
MKNFLKIFVLTCLALPLSGKTQSIIVLETDFGTKDSAVSALRAVIRSVDKNILVEDLTHEIPPFDIWEGAYRLYQSVSYWPKGTIFVHVIDPGVGTTRRSIVAKSKTGYYFVGPDNGTLTWIEQKHGLESIREIDLKKNRLHASDTSHTFFGRDVYAYTAAKLASGEISFEGVGSLISTPPVKLQFENVRIENNKLIGSICALDPQYGNVWTNIEEKQLKEFGFQKGAYYKITILNGEETIFCEAIPYCDTFGNVLKGDNLLYLNSLYSLAIGSNQLNFSSKYQVKSGEDWKIIVEPADLVYP